jgi:3-hydroxybutyrate dehydrogenase
MSKSTNNKVPQSLAGQHALVTGGATGIGFAIANALLAQHCKVSIAGRTEVNLQRAVEELRSIGEVSYVVMDVADHASVHAGFAKAVAQLGVVDILINNAGQAQSAAFLKTDNAMWQQMLGVNLTGTFYCSQQALPAMLEAGWGRIVNVASTAGVKAYSYVAAYCAAKHGVIGLTKSLAQEFANKGITINAVCPGYTDTALVSTAITTIVEKTGVNAEQAMAHFTSSNPQQRLITPEEVANAVVWLCQPDSAAINGQSIVVAGGEVM